MLVDLVELVRSGCDCSCALPESQHQQSQPPLVPITTARLLPMATLPPGCRQPPSAYHREAAPLPPAAPEPQANPPHPIQAVSSNRGALRGERGLRP